MKNEEEDKVVKIGKSFPGASGHYLSDNEGVNKAIRGMIMGLQDEALCGLHPTTIHSMMEESESFLKAHDDIEWGELVIAGTPEMINPKPIHNICMLCDDNVDVKVAEHLASRTFNEFQFIASGGIGKTTSTSRMSMSNTLIIDDYSAITTKYVPSKLTEYNSNWKIKAAHKLIELYNENKERQSWDQY